uniref:Uncharacterized protein n=1 Tax=Kalanchoe fedtschenkoi TaxID=63787 RepID=A0A7N0RAQ2_KALFE
MSKNKIHPCKKWSRRPDGINQKDIDEAGGCSSSEPASVLTVWKKSSMSFQGTDGFTVFDDSGRLCFRVENYSRYKHRSFGLYGGCGALVLMDGAGRPLLTLKPQMFSLQRQWDAYAETECLSDGHQSLQTFVFTMRKQTTFAHKSYQIEAEIFMGKAEGAPVRKCPDFSIEGSFKRRSCRITRFPGGEVIATISRKKVTNMTVFLSDEVFSLAVVPGFSCELVMAFVVILDRICGAKYIPSLCCGT